LFSRILVGLDGSKASWNAVFYAFEFAKRLNIPVVGIHVIDERLIEESFLEDLAGVLGFTYYEGISAKVKEFLENQADVLLEEFLSMGRSMGLKVSSFQTTGVPYREIIAQADREDILFLGKYGKRPVKGFFLGSTSDIVIRRSPCPVFLCSEERREIKKVCVAYDGKPLSERALEIGKFVRELFNGELYAIHVEQEEKVEAPNVENYEVLKGFPEEKIVEYCKEKGMDLLLMGAFSKGRLKEFLFGSITSFVIDHLQIPILLVR